MARAARRRVLAGLVALAVLPPVAWFGVGVRLERDRAEAAALATAWMLDRQIEAQHMWEPRDAALLLRRSPIGDGAERRRVLDTSGSVLAEGVDERVADWPMLTVTQPLQPASGHEALVVEIGHSLRPLALATGAVALLGTLLAIGLWAGAFRRPFGALRQAEHRLNSIARRDSLTGLLNRDGLRMHLARAIERRRDPRKTVGVLLIDLDRFRLVNDSLGHRVGDQLLRGVADRICSVARDGDVVARLGADQVAIQAEGISGAQALDVMARNLMRVFESPHALGGHDAMATLSIGIACAGEHAKTPDELLQCADAAMRAAKAAGGSRACVYEPAMNVDTAQQLETDLRLRRALHAQEFFLVFQPIVAADGERVLAVEALLRWSDPGRGIVSPADFIPVLEQTGLIVQVGRWVMAQACRQGVAWIAGEGHDLMLSVNVSPRQFAEADFVDTVLGVLEETRFPASRLQLEVTEGLLLDPTPESLHKIDRLTGAGVRLAVDDFGMGYSSLAYLKRFRLHALKIDRMFVRDIPLHRQDAAIARAIVELGHGLGLVVTAEGVETVEQCQELRRIGCDSMQGFLFARPMKADEMTALLARPGACETSRGDAVPDWSHTMEALLDDDVRR
jgi:diguanylate cyclase (GGDEF)-like protein